MSRRLIKTNHRNLVRDMSNGAILNVDANGAKEYKRMRDKVKNKDKEVAELKNQVAQLTDLVHQLLNKE